MIWQGWVALGLGVVVFAAVALALSPHEENTDPTMKWEGGIAIGCALGVSVGPLWVAQGGFTIFAGSGLLWAWWAAAPLLGASRPARAVARLVRP